MLFCTEVRSDISVSAARGAEPGCLGRFLPLRSGWHPRVAALYPIIIEKFSIVCLSDKEDGIEPSSPEFDGRFESVHSTDGRPLAPVWLGMQPMSMLNHVWHGWHHPQ